MKWSAFRGQEVKGEDHMTPKASSLTPLPLVEYKLSSLLDVKLMNLRESSFFLLTNFEIALNDLQDLFTLVVVEVSQVQFPAHLCSHLVDFSLNTQYYTSFKL